MCVYYEVQNASITLVHFGFAVYFADCGTAKFNSPAEFSGNDNLAYCNLSLLYQAFSVSNEKRKWGSPGLQGYDCNLCEL